MINLKQGNKLLTDLEVLDNIADYISCNVGAQDWQDHIEMISGYIGAGINKHEQEVIGYLKSSLKF